jgi:hypothetical protein
MTCKIYVTDIGLNSYLYLKKYIMSIFLYEMKEYIKFLKRERIEINIQPAALLLGYLCSEM